MQGFKRQSWRTLGKQIIGLGDLGAQPLNLRVFRREDRKTSFKIVPLKSRNYVVTCRTLALAYKPLLKPAFNSCRIDRLADATGAFSRPNH